MLYESFSLLRSNGVDKRCPDEPGEEIGVLGRVVAMLVSVAIAGSTIFAVAMPFALLHLR